MFTDHGNGITFLQERRKLAKENFLASEGLGMEQAGMSSKYM